MKNNYRSIVFLAVFALSLSSLWIVRGTFADSVGGDVGFATPTPTPKPAARPREVPSITPSPTPIASPTPVPAQTLEFLQSRISARLFSPDVRRGRVGIKVVSLNTGKVIFENESEKYFIPASNMKNFTVATAIEKLTPDFKFITSVTAAAAPDASGVIKGDLTIVGRGDVSISTRFTNGDYYKRLDDLADKIAQAGVKRIEGSIVGDESYFSGDPVNATWEVEDITTPDGVEISALPINDNAIDVTVQPAAAASPCNVKVSPPNPVMRVVNTCVTGARGSIRTLSVVKDLNQNVLEVSGNLPSGDSGYSESIAISHPAELFIALLKQRLELKGVIVTGTTRTTRERPAASQTQLPVELARLESPPLSFIAAQTMKPSQNMYAETLLWTLGEYNRARTSFPTVNGVSGGAAGSSQLGLGEIKNFLANIGVSTDGIIQYDGSGMSRRDGVTPASIVQLYTYMAKQSRYAQVWRDALAVGGVDGTLKRRFAGTAASGNFRGKTGTLSQVSALSGYMTTAGGDPLVISIIVNGVAEPRARTSLMDDIVIQLANFNGKID